MGLAQNRRNLPSNQANNVFVEKFCHYQLRRLGSHTVNVFSLQHRYQFFLPGRTHTLDHVCPLLIPARVSRVKNVARIYGILTPRTSIRTAYVHESVQYVSRFIFQDIFNYPTLRRAQIPG